MMKTIYLSDYNNHILERYYKMGLRETVYFKIFAMDDSPLKAEIILGRGCWSLNPDTYEEVNLK